MEITVGCFFCNLTCLLSVSVLQGLCSVCLLSAKKTSWPSPNYVTVVSSFSPEHVLNISPPVSASYRESADHRRKYRQLHQCSSHIQGGTHWCTYCIWNTIARKLSAPIIYPKREVQHNISFFLFVPQRLVCVSACRSFCSFIPFWDKHSVWKLIVHWSRLQTIYLIFSSKLHFKKKNVVKLHIWQHITY